MPRLNVQADIRTRLAEALPTDVEVRVSVPDPRPETLVVVTREGGHRLNPLQDRAGIGILVWSTSEEKAYDIACKASEVMYALPFAAGYEAVDEESMRSDPDPSTKSPRWYASYTVTTHVVAG